MGTVLIVDDEDGLRELLQDLLQTQGYVCEAARDGVEALELLHRHDDICFILLDVVMPRLDGIAVLREIERDPELRDIPLCMATATPERVPHGVKYLTKPIELRKLFGLLDQHCA